MKRMVLIMVAACLVAGVGMTDELDIGVRGGYGRLGSSNDGAFLLGLFGRKNWFSELFTEVGVLYHEERVDGLDVEVIPLQFSALLYFLRRDTEYCPYLLGGVGLYTVRYNDTVHDETDTEFDFGGHLGFGMDYLLSDKVFVECDFRYAWLDVDFEGRTVKDTLSDFDSWVATLGIGFRL